MNRTLTEQELEFLRGVDSPTVANAIERLSVRDRTEGFIGGNVQCTFPDLGVMTGRALTVRVSDAPGPPPQREQWWRMWEELDGMDGPTVLVFADASGSPHRVAYAGEVMVRLARRLGAVGMVTDGALRDLDEVHALGFHYFMRYPVVSHANFEIVSVGEPVVVDGQQIRTGDLLHGDANGIVVVPWEGLPGLPEQVEAVRSTEAAEMAYIESADFSLDGLKQRRGYGTR
ncbi:RraA family protein [Serinicoccus kebangsaanensis]|uniref:RraA family protein n=1 Tax=Serinicoccus kebangsaanensis TaxID=2602069 RepID=UPI00124CD5A6|nr:RraA family protein [Serinicoccus kebangsaanensis]